MYWHDYNKEPPQQAGCYYILLLLISDEYDNNKWYDTKGIYNPFNKRWTILIDDIGWRSDIGIPSYYLKIPEFPPIPYEGPICEYLYGDDYCSAQKNTPRCYCQGDKNKCECKENFSYD